MARNGGARQPGFSLTETLMAVGTLAIGMTFIAGTFISGVYFATVSTERTIGVVVAEEAFSKVRLYGLDPNRVATDGSVLYDGQLSAMPEAEFVYPSTAPDANRVNLNTLESEQRQYSWSALCRRMGADSPLVQCTVFVCRAAGTNSDYHVRESGTTKLTLQTSVLPRPVPVIVVWDAAASSPNNPEISLRDAVPTDAVDELAFVHDGSILVDDETGRIYRVLERDPARPDRIRLERDQIWVGAVDGSTGWAWVVPSAVAGGRNPVVGVYQKVLRLPGG